MTTIPKRSHADVLAQVLTYLNTQLSEKPKTPVSGSTRLVHDLGLDSLQSFEMVSDLEDQFELTIPMDLLQGVETVDDLARLILRVAMTQEN